MLQNKFEMPLDLAVKKSKLFFIYLVVILLLSVVSIFITSLALILQVFLLFFLIGFSFLIFKKQNINNITLLKLSSTDEWKIEIDNEHILNAKLQGECIVTHFLVWLNFTTSNRFGREKAYHVLLLPDSADKNVLRQLRVRLRFLKNEVESTLE